MSFFKAAVGFLSLVILWVIAHIVDYVLIYWVYIYIQMLITPLFTAIGYLFYLLRLVIPYMFMYFLICIFLNLPAYKKKNIIKLSRYSIDIRTVRTNKILIYLYQYNYALIFGLNLLLLFIVYYYYLHNNYLYVLCIILFYLFIWIIIKIKHWLFKDQTLQYKKVNILVNLILVFLVGIYISIVLEDLHISNSKLYGFENFWKLIDNKYFIKMPPKDVDWNRIFNWSRQTSMDRYTFEKTLALNNKKIELIDYENTSTDLSFKEKVQLSNNINDDINMNSNLSIFEKLHKMQNKDYHLGQFTNSIYKKFKKVFLIQLHMKSYNFLPTSEITERQKLFNWLNNPSNKIDLSKYYLSDEVIQNPLYENYLDLIDKKCNLSNLTTVKTFMITLHKNNINLKSLLFYADFEYSFKMNYFIFLNSKDKYLLDDNLLEFNYNNILPLELDINYVWKELQHEIFIALKENKIAFAALSKKFKNIYTFKHTKFSFKKDVLSDSELKLHTKSKEKFFGIPDFKKLKIWKTFKLNYKEIIYKHTIEEAQKLEKKVEIDEKVAPLDDQLSSEEILNDLFFVVDNDIVYSLSDNLKLKQVQKLLFNIPLDSAEDYFDLSDFINGYLNDMINNLNNLELSGTNKYSVVLTNDVENYIDQIKNKRVHVPTFSSLYHEIILLNSKGFPKYVLENSEFSRHLLTSFRSFLPFGMWQNLMHKLLNLDAGTSSLGTLKDVSNNIDIDFQYNFSLAFNILQNKYDYDSAKYQMISEVEGIGRSCYEYMVKYNALIDNYIWHEEQEALIDWIYEMSFDAIVNLMDTVKEISDKENDFLFDLINIYSKESRYIWAAESFDKRSNKFISTPENIAKVEAKYKLLIKMIQANERQYLFLLKEVDNFRVSKQEAKLLDLAFIKKYKNKGLLDFNDIENLKQFNWKFNRDYFIIKTLPHKIKTAYFQYQDSLADDQLIWDDAEWHSDVFETMGEIYQYRQRTLNLDLGVVGGKGDLILNQSVFIDDMDLLDDFLEDRAYEKMDFFFEEYCEATEMGFLTEIFNDLDVDYLNLNVDVLNHYYKIFLVNYKNEMLKSYSKLLIKLYDDIDNKKIMLENNEKQREFLKSLKKQFPEEMSDELRNVELDQTPIFDWSTNTFIEENIDLIKKENPDLLLKMMDRLDKELDLFNNKSIILKDTKEIYKQQVIKYLQTIDPVNKKLTENNWNDYNYFCNKNDKYMMSLYKAKKK